MVSNGSFKVVSSAGQLYLCRFYFRIINEKELGESYEPYFRYARKNCCRLAEQLHVIRLYAYKTELNDLRQIFTSAGRMKDTCDKYSQVHKF